MHLCIHLFVLPKLFCLTYPQPLFCRASSATQAGPAWKWCPHLRDQRWVPPTLWDSLGIQRGFAGKCTVYDGQWTVYEWFSNSSLTWYGISYCHVVPHLITERYCVSILSKYQHVSSTCASAQNFPWTDGSNIKWESGWPPWLETSCICDIVGQYVNIHTYLIILMFLYLHISLSIYIP